MTLPKKTMSISVIITAVATILASLIGGWATANTRVSDIDTKVQVVEERENNHYSETSKKLDSIDEKLDKILVKQSQDIN